MCIRDRYNIKFQHGRYRIQVTNPFDGEFEYMILMQSKDVHLLHLDNANFGVVHQNQTDYYEIQLNRPGIVHLTIDNFVGRALPQISSSYKNLVKGIYDVHYENFAFYHTPQENIYLRLNNTSDKFFLGIKYLDGPIVNDALREAFYKLLPQVRSLSDVSSNNYLFEPGNAGVIEYNMDSIKGKQFSFAFAPVSIAGELRSDDKNGQIQHFSLAQHKGFYNSSGEYQIQYTMYISNDEVYLGLLTKCGALMSSDSKVPPQFELKHGWYRSFYVNDCDAQAAVCKFNVTLKDDIYVGKLYATIKAKIINVAQGHQSKVTYRFIEFYANPVYSRLEFIMVATIILIIILTLVLWIFYKKYKKIKKEIKVEMQGIRNIASMNREDGRSAAQDIIEKIQYGKMSEEDL
eukprot:TRINITY_DN999_c0_g3_i2.p1 TRINITY_DN999_c0_g3~~TRINITY_DN999_c0_g3_i2.p1  ORF type:complete len:404 (-),score=64.33 TRINITY_DN999_c0_g3_i2:61-1272(-)